MTETNNFDNIPQELKALKRWVLWKYLPRGNSKPAKEPYKPGYQYTINALDPQNQSNFEDVVSTYNGGGYDGIGFVFTKEDPYAGIDVDNCITGDDLKESIAVWVRRFGSYTEPSPSGTGLHTIINTDLDFYQSSIYVDCLENKVEYYNTFANWA